MGMCVKTAVVYGFELVLDKEQVNFLKEESQLSIFPITYRENESRGLFLVGESVAELGDVNESQACNIEGLEAIEQQIVEILKEVGVEINKKAQIIVTSYYH